MGEKMCPSTPCMVKSGRKLVTMMRQEKMIAVPTWLEAVRTVWMRPRRSVAASSLIPCCSFS